MVVKNLLIVNKHNFFIGATGMATRAKGFHIGVGSTAALVRWATRNHARVLFVGDASGAKDAVLLQVPVLARPVLPAGGDGGGELLVALAQGALAVSVICALLVHGVG